MDEADTEGADGKGSRNGMEWNGVEPVTQVLGEALALGLPSSCPLNSLRNVLVRT